MPLTKETKTKTTERLMTVYELAALLGVSRGGVYQLLRRGRIPNPVKLGRRCVRWRVAEVDEWIRNGCRMEADE